MSAGADRSGGAAAARGAGSSGPRARARCRLSVGLAHRYVCLADSGARSLSRTHDPAYNNAAGGSETARAYICNLHTMRRLSASAVVLRLEKINLELFPHLVF